MVEHQSQMDNRYPPSTPMDQVSTALPSVTADESDSDICDSSPEINEYSTKQESRQSYYSSDTSLQIAADNTTLERSKKQVSMSANENVIEINTTAVQGSSVSHETVDKPATPLPTYMLNFERPKSGCDSLSWNALPLAINSNFLTKRMQ